MQRLSIKAESTVFEIPVIKTSAKNKCSIKLNFLEEKMFGQFLSVNLFLKTFQVIIVPEVFKSLG